MRDITVTVRTINKYQTEVLIDETRVVLTDMKKVNAAKARRRKVGDAIINMIIIIAFSVLIIRGVMLSSIYNKGHYEPDCIRDGVLYDTDGDGDYYHWVDHDN